MSQSNRHVVAALSTLILLQLIMLAALFAGIKPHPPAAIPLFGIAPFLGAALSIAVCALILGPLDTTAGRSLSTLAALLALVSFGPQKYFDSQFGLIYPAVIPGQIAALVIFARVFSAMRTTDAMGAQETVPMATR